MLVHTYVTNKLMFKAKDNVTVTAVAGMRPDGVPEAEWNERLALMTKEMKDTHNMNTNTDHRVVAAVTLAAQYRLRQSVAERGGPGYQGYNK